MLKFKDRHGFRLLKGGVEKHETNRMALRREIKEETGLQEFSIVEAIGTYAYANGGMSHLVNVYHVRCSKFDGETRPGGPDGNGHAVIEDVCWLRVKDAVHSLLSDERTFLMKALDIQPPQPAVQIIDPTARKTLPAMHFLKRRFTTFARPSLPATLSHRPRPR